MKKAFHILTLALAINFIAVAAGTGWLIQAGRLDRERFEAIRLVLFPPPPSPEPVELRTESSTTTRPTERLDALLARQSRRPATEQVELIQRSFDAQMAVLDRRQRELSDLQRQVELAKEQLARDRVALDQQAQRLAQRESEAVRLQSDKGFQDSLALYTTMQPRQVKSIFMELDDQTMIDYLQAMQPRTAARILREFKAPEEISRVEKVLEKMRQADASPEE